MYYCPDIETTHILPEEESQHCVQVLRAKIGEEIDVADGNGTIYHCRVTNPHRKHCEVEIVSSEIPSPLHHGHIHVAVAPTKMMERLEWFVEKATEMGIDEITLLLCEHSERKVVNAERVRKVMIAAAKQSLRASYPVINDLTPYNEFVTSHAGYIAHCEDGYAPTDGRRFLREYISAQSSDVTVLIGPEGDFSPAEISLALEHKWIPVSLGNGRLRTETAALVACHTAVLAME